MEIYHAVIYVYIKHNQLKRNNYMGLSCLLFGHRKITDDWISIDIGGAQFYLTVCVKCQCFIAKPANKKATYIFMDKARPVGLIHD
jgi:hypothetical protein